MAMLLEISLEEAIELVGKRGQTDTKDLVTALRKGGIKVAERRVPSRGQGLPSNCIVYARWPFTKKSGHWLLRWQGRNYDPATEWGDKDYIITSFLPLG